VAVYEGLQSEHSSLPHSTARVGTACALPQALAAEERRAQLEAQLAALGAQLEAQLSHAAKPDLGDGEEGVAEELEALRAQLAEQHAEFNELLTCLGQETAKVRRYAE
jgi:DNA anti-recombination protein RmuC